MQMGQVIMIVLAFNTFVVLGVGVAVVKYLINNERRLARIETKIGLH